MKKKCSSEGESLTEVFQISNNDVVPILMIIGVLLKSQLTQTDKYVTILAFI